MTHLIPFLSAVRDLCAQRGETDAVALAHAAGRSLDETHTAIEAMDEQGLARVEEYGFSCSVEYSILGLTPRGLALLDGSD